MTSPSFQDPRSDLVRLWSSTLAQADQTDPHVTVRPAETQTEAGQESRVPSGSRSGELRLRRPTTISSLDGAAPHFADTDLSLGDIDRLVASRERYMLGPVLGRGGMGVVVEAVQLTLGRSVAVKVARGDLSGRQLDRFRTESKCTAWLEHPNIVPVYDAGLNYLVMRRIDGNNLEEELLADRLDLSAIVEILIKVCDAVSFAHHRGIIHRDIKPENIMLGRFGEVLLADWGLALTGTAPGDGILRAPQLSDGASACAGTPGYMAPEVALADRRAISFATDVFLLGATLYRCLSGAIPFPGADAWQAIERSAVNAWTPLGEPSAARPKRLIALQEQAMSTDPKARPTVAAFQAGLREWLLRSRSESEALRELAAAREHFNSAQGHRLHPHEAYLDLSETIAACDRAIALNPGLAPANDLREEACSFFTLAAVGAGEPQLARLIKQSGRLPVLAAAQTKTAPSGQGGTPGHGSLVRRVSKLLPKGGTAQGDMLASLVEERLHWRKECENLTAETEVLRSEREALRADRDALAAVANEQRRVLSHRHWPILIAAATGVLLGALLVGVMR